MHNQWYETDEALPADGQRVMTMNSVGHESELVYKSNLWWLPDMSMYVYYSPKMWKEIR